MTQTDLQGGNTRTAKLSRTFIWGSMLLLLLLGFYLRLPSVLDASLNMDESMHANIASGATLADVWRYSQHEIHPPLFYFLLHYWRMISDAPPFLHLMTLLLGVLLIPIYYLIGKRLNGEFCGLCCAALVAVSDGCITQSYVLRQYCVLLPCLALNFYCYLVWRQSRGRIALLAYIFFGWLGMLSHFSAIFYSLTLTLFEGMRLLHQRAGMRLIAKWCLANLVIAAFALYLYHVWSPVIDAYQGYFKHFFGFPADFHVALYHMLFTPLGEASYLFPTFPLVTALIVYAFIARYYSPDWRPYFSAFSLAMFTCFISMALYISRIYANGGGRHDIWMLPLFLPAAGIMVAESLKSSGSMKLVILLAIITTMYEVDERKHHRDELPSWSPGQQQAITAMKALPPSDLIFTVKDTGVMFANLYAAIDNDVFSARKMAAVLPFGNTHILFNPYYANEYSTPIMMATLEEAQKSHMLDNIDRLVFVQEPWRAAAIDLAMCNALQKEFQLFPPLDNNRKPSRDDFNGKIILMFISKEDIEKKVIAPGGSARSCLNGKHDDIPGYQPVTKP